MGLSCFRAISGMGWMGWVGSLCGAIVWASLCDANKTKFEVSISKSVTVQIWGDLPLDGWACLTWWSLKLGNLIVAKTSWKIWLMSPVLGKTSRHTWTDFQLGLTLTKSSATLWWCRWKGRGTDDGERFGDKCCQLYKMALFCIHAEYL